MASLTDLWNEINQPQVSSQLPDQAAQHRILVSNPAKLYGFPN